MVFVILIVSCGCSAARKTNRARSRHGTAVRCGEHDVCALTQFERVSFSSRCTVHSVHSSRLSSNRVVHMVHSVLSLQHNRYDSSCSCSQNLIRHFSLRDTHKAPSPFVVTSTPPLSAFRPTANVSRRGATIRTARWTDGGYVRKAQVSRFGTLHLLRLLS